jgi:16S rRNA (adenine1518-N6/adenine1519-N6)-dimethyltransferase
MVEKKKSLGQHFLHNAHYLEAVANAAGISKGMQVLEIGPGDGALTAVLLQQGARVIAIEKDRRLIPVLTEKFAEEIKSGQLQVIETDALEFEPKGTIEGEYTVVGNIPYYITGALLKKYLTSAPQPATLVFLIQKEVAERITNHGLASKNPKESILSLSVKVYGEPRYVTTVPAGAFNPPPNVDSAILAVTNISRKNFEAKTLSDKVRPTPREAAFREALFFEIVKSGFAQKRKLLKRNVEAVLGKNTSEVLTKAGIADNARAEDVPLEKWLGLTEHSAIY